MKPISSKPCRGYIEGYYGQLLSWGVRSKLVRQLSQQGLSSYFYAPKEDVYHRLQWREPYPSNWRNEFAEWARMAQAHSVQIIAGVAPGLDFNFSHLVDGNDFLSLVNKAQQLLDDGASSIALLMDDINAEFDPSHSHLSTEGQAHAVLANALSEQLDCSIFVVPRVYAQELDHESPGYAQQFSAQLNTGNAVFHCGTHIVSASIDAQDYRDYTDSDRHRVIVWDNLYANDYCPRRLFVGPWLGRSKMTEVMLNPTGMPSTDALLIDIMVNSTTGNSAEKAQQEALKFHGVPEQFLAIAHYFCHPVFSDSNLTDLKPLYSREQQLAAIEYLLWKWKTPLSREWYPYLFGLKHDLMISTGELSEMRINKTQLEPLAMKLTHE